MDMLAELSHIGCFTPLFRGFQKWLYPKMDGLKGKILLTQSKMDEGYPHFRNPPCQLAGSSQQDHLVGRYRERIYCLSHKEPASIYVSGTTVGIQPIQELGVLQIVQIRSGNHYQTQLSKLSINWF